MDFEKKYIEISLVYKEDEKYKIEKVYAQKIGDLFQIKSIPAFAQNIAYDDIVSVEYEEGEMFFNQHVTRSGHSVVHIVVLNSEISANFFADLISFGVNINYLHNNTYLVIDVPSNVSYNKFRKYLITEIEHGNIDVNEASISDIHLKGW